MEALMENVEQFDAYDILDAREAEVWTAILTVASVVCPQNVDDLIRVAVDLGTLKQTTDKRRFSEIRKEAEAATNDAAFSERAMKDLASIFRHNEQRVSSDEAIERMKAIQTAPWRTYRGTGLTQKLLSDLVSVFGVNTKSVKIRGKSPRGFQRSDVERGAKKLEA
jgi:hypothetical protein